MLKFFTPSRSLLILILALAIFLRFWNLGHIPPSTSMDEASIGYNAYSVLKTGGDEYGMFPLVSQRAYDDWRRSTYLLLTIPTIATFGLNSIAIRLPAVILSILTVWATYHIVLLLFKKRTTFSIGAALLATFLLAISPWHIYISRLGHESNACLSFLVFGVLFFLQGLKKTWKLFLSGFFFALSLISYYSGQALIPLFGMGLLIIFRKELLQLISANKKLLIPIGLFILFLIPVFWSVFSPAAMIRFQGTSTFNPNVHPEEFRQEVLQFNTATAQHNIFGVIYYNRRLFPVKIFIGEYLSHFNPTWLFTNSGEDSFKAPNTGLLYLWELPLILTGIWCLIFSGLIDWKGKSLVLLWFFLAPIPASIATQAPHAMRSYNFLPTWQIFVAVGIAYIVYKLRKIRIFIIPIIALAIIIGFVNFCKNYYYVFPQQQSHSFAYAMSRTVPFVEKEQGKYQKVIFSNQNSLYQSYMVFLYYTKFDPKLYQKLGGTISGGYAETHAFGKYEFRPIVWAKDQQLTNVLLVGNVSDFPSNTPGKVFTDLDGGGAIKVVAR